MLREVVRERTRCFGFEGPGNEPRAPLSARTEMTVRS